MDEMSTRPRPGTPNTCSTTMEPAMMSPMAMARKVTTGIMALRSTCLRRAEPRLLPLL